MNEELRKKLAENLINLAASAAHLTDEELDKMMRMSLDKMPGIPEDIKEQILEISRQQLIPVRNKK
mgnify:CR=1 FL=1